MCSRSLTKAEEGGPVRTLWEALGNYVEEVFVRPEAVGSGGTPV